MPDVSKANTSNDIKNGTMVVTCGTTGFPNSPATIVYNKYVLNTPTIGSIENKFENRFDDPAYYYGIGNSGIIGV